MNGDSSALRHQKRGKEGNIREEVSEMDRVKEGEREQTWKKTRSERRSETCIIKEKI